MSSAHRYRTTPFTTNRRMAAASAAVCAEYDSIHAITEVDITEPRRLIREHRERTGEKLSLTAYVVACLARTVTEFPGFNAIRSGGKLIVFDDVTVGTLVERTIGGEVVPEPVPIPAADKLTYRQINDLIRAAAEAPGDQLGTLSGMTWVPRLIPSWLFKTFIRIASRNARVAATHGCIAVTAVGMFGPSPMWLVPLSASTVAVAVGSIVKRVAMLDGAPVEREHLCLTISFDHDLIDGAPAARFTKRFAEVLAGGDVLRDL